jgi:hypothetical protein
MHKLVEEWIKREEEEKEKEEKEYIQKRINLLTKFEIFDDSEKQCVTAIESMLKGELPLHVIMLALITRGFIMGYEIRQAEEIEEAQKFFKKGIAN